MGLDPQFDALMLLFLILCLLKLLPPPLLMGATVNGPTGPQDFRLDASTLQTKKKKPNLDIIRPCLAAGGNFLLFGFLSFL